jgi:hypothetical protein
MTSVQLHLKNQTVITIENLTAIKIFYTSEVIALKPDTFEQLQVNPELSYCFVGASETVSIFGADLLYVQCVKS